MTMFPADLSLSESAWEAALLSPPQGRWSVEEYLALTDDLNRFIEYTDGKIEVLAMPTFVHQRIMAYLFSLMKLFVDERRLGEVLPCVLRVRVDQEKFREPDILFLSNETLARQQNRFSDAADLVVEIVSDDHESHVRDHAKKPQDYAAAKIPEYWIVDPQKRQISVLVLEGDKYATLGDFVPGQQATSRLLPGFVVDVAETFNAAAGPV